MTLEPNMLKDIALFTEVLTALEKRSTCARIQVAALFVKQGRIISTGWNGVAAGHTHCKDHFANHTHEQMLAEHRAFSIAHERHAERNGIDFAKENGIDLTNSDCYVTYSPCPDCAELIKQAGVRRVYFKLPYDRMPQGISMLENAGIECIQVPAVQNLVK